MVRPAKAQAAKDFRDTSTFKEKERAAQAYTTDKKFLKVYNRKLAHPDHLKRAAKNQRFISAQKPVRQTDKSCLEHDLDQQVQSINFFQKDKLQQKPANKEHQASGVWQVPHKYSNPKLPMILNPRGSSVLVNNNHYS